MRVLAIDPGNIHSGYALIDADTCKPIEVGKIDNELLRDALLDWCIGDLDAMTDVDERPPGSVDHIAIEMVASYGMAVGKEVFETCVWIGRFQQAWHIPDSAKLIYRRDVKLHLCGNAKAKDPNIRQALLDLIGPAGTKKQPGPTYGVKSHAWAALAVAVTVAGITPESRRLAA